MNCKELERMIPEFLEGEISVDEKKAFNEHILGCEICASLLKKMIAANAMIGEFMISEPKPFYTTRVMQRIESASEEWYSLVPVFKGRLAAAFTVFVVALGIFLGINFGSQLSSLTNMETVSGTEYLAQEYYLDDVSDNSMDVYLLEEK
ncbi:MAG: zf-HC2 domain-containing protein [Bacteroidales bacterium]|nr:zf-HC2 domain-containing protein [Bacteroidales bacterium]